MSSTSSQDQFDPTSFDMQNMPIPISHEGSQKCKYNVCNSNKIDENKNKGKRIV